MNPGNYHCYRQKSLGGKLMWNFIMDELKQHYGKATDQSIKSRASRLYVSLDTIL